MLDPKLPATVHVLNVADTRFCGSSTGSARGIRELLSIQPRVLKSRARDSE